MLLNDAESDCRQARRLPLSRLHRFCQRALDDLAALFLYYASLFLGRLDIAASLGHNRPRKSETENQFSLTPVALQTREREETTLLS
jgi:hypothetical protein